MKWLKYYREKLRLSQKVLADNVGVQENTVWRWENDRAVPSAEIVKRLAVIFGCTEAELLNGPAKDNWELKLVTRKAGAPQEGVIDMTSTTSSATLNIGDTAMAITLSAPYTLWEDEEQFEQLLEDLRRKRVAGLKTRREDW